jgi:protoporphyrinogen oxidase
LWQLKQKTGTKKGTKNAVSNFEEFILAHFGEGIARHFLIPYNEKTWGVHPREMTAAWCRRFVPVPPVEHILAGAVGASVPEMGYTVKFWYPRSGGIGALPNAMAGRLKPDRIHYQSQVEAVDHKRRAVKVGGQWIGYRALVSTMPLPELCRRLSEPPGTVVRAAERLRWTSVMYLDVATSAPPAADFHWVYVPEKRYPFYRVGIYSNAVGYMAPKGCGSMYVELSTRKRNLTLDKILPDTLDALTAVGVLTGPDTVRFARLRVIEHAYVIYDRHYAAARRTLLSFFKRHGIYSCGRYGSWVYSPMEDSLKEGDQVGQMLR